MISSVHNKLLKDDLFSVLTALIGYLCHRKLLVGCIGKVCPEVALTRWLLVHKVMVWFQRHCIGFKAHLDEKNHLQNPDSSWWVFTASVSEFYGASVKLFKKIQGLTTFTAQQYLYIMQLVSKFKRLSGAKGPLADLERRACNPGVITNSAFIIEHSIVKEYIHGLGCFVQGIFNEIKK